MVPLLRLDDVCSISETYDNEKEPLQSYTVGNPLDQSRSSRVTHSQSTSWGFVKRILQNLVMYWIFPTRPIEVLDAKRGSFIHSGNNGRHIELVYKGKCFSAFVERSGIVNDSSNWVLKATDGPYERDRYGVAANDCAIAGLGYHTLYVNMAGYGRSEGSTTIETIGDAQEAGLRFIEEIEGVQKVALIGTRSGGASLGQMLLKHDFKRNIEYKVIRDHNFDRMSHMVASFIARPGRWLYQLISRLLVWANCEVDNVAASKRLAKKGIEEVTIEEGVAGKQGTLLETALETLASYDHVPHLDTLEMEKAKRPIDEEAANLVRTTPTLDKGVTLTTALVQEAASMDMSKKKVYLLGNSERYSFMTGDERSFAYQYLPHCIYTELYNLAHS